METTIGVHTDLFGATSDKLELKGQAELKVSVRLETDGEKTVAVVKYNDKEVKVSGDDVLSLKHRFTVKAVREMAPDLLPISISYRGNDYQLRRTRSGKLVLNK